MQQDLPAGHALGEGALDGERDADAHDPQEGGEHQVTGQQPVPRGVLQEPVPARPVVHEYHKHYRHPTRNTRFLTTEKHRQKES